MAVDFIAGLNGGIAGLVAAHPMDTIKVRLQMQSSAAPRYRGAFHCFFSIIRQESPLALYKGMATPVLSASCLNAVVFGVYGPCIRRLDSSKLSHHFTAGCIAGLVQSPICCLVELSKIRVQMQGVGERSGKIKNRIYSGSINAVYKIIMTEGIRGCFRGMIFVTIRDVFGFGVYFACYEGLCRYFGKTSDQDDLPFAPLMLAGGFAGMASWASIYNLDVVKTRFQVDGVGGKCKYQTYRDVMRDIYQTNGLRGFFSGLGVTMVRAFPSNAAIFGTVSLTFRLFGLEK